MPDRCSYRFENMPQSVKALLAALNFSDPDGSALRRLAKSDWDLLLTCCDRWSLSLPLYLRCGRDLPSAVAARLHSNLNANKLRWQSLKQAYSELALRLERRAIPFLVLKGFGQWPLFVAQAHNRAQYDLDLLVRPEHAREAAWVARELGYEAPNAGTVTLTDHLPTMIRRTGWRWRGDYYDADIPCFLEIHTRCWNQKGNFFGPDNLEKQFWNRACQRTCEDLQYSALSPADSITYAGLHALRHILHGNLKLSHIYEIAFFLEHSASDEALWKEWQLSVSGGTRDPVAICFYLAHEWFGGTMGTVPARSIDLLPGTIHRWLNVFKHSPIATVFHPNKDELWLHWALVENKRDKLVLARRKLFPKPPPVLMDEPCSKKRKSGALCFLARHWRYFLFLIARLRHHALALPSTIVSAAVWFGSPSSVRGIGGKSSKFTSVLQSRDN